MSTTLPEIVTDPRPDPASDPAEAPPPRRRRWPYVVAAGVLVAAIAGTAILIPVLHGGAAADPSAPASATATAAVERRTVSAQSQVDGTLGYAGDLSVVGQLPGTVTAIPAVGAVIEPGQALYRVDGAPVVLLWGSVPAWRTLASGTKGVDAQQLNAALVALGYAGGLGLDPASDTVTWRTVQAIKRLQAALGIAKTGALDLGQAVFLPGALRVTAVPAVLGSPAGPGQTVLQGTSTTPQIDADVPVALAQRVKAGDAVTVTLPDQTTAKGTVVSVGTVAATSGSGGSATIPIVIRLADPGAAAGLDQAPVSVAITTATVDDALVVPVTALLARPAGGYAVEVADAKGTHLVAVGLGLFDGAGGVVQVTGHDAEARLKAGQRVVVPSP
jgi:hypothetical protein